jgi:hypothetical protein
MYCFLVFGRFALASKQLAHLLEGNDSASGFGHVRTAAAPAGRRIYYVVGMQGSHKIK